MSRLTYFSTTLPQRPWFLSSVVFLVSLTLYTFTLAPGLLWGGHDFARNQTWAYLGSVDAVDVGTHPLWVWLAHPFIWLPWNDIAWRINFASAFFASVALVFVFLSALRLTNSKWSSFLSTMALGVSHTFWTYSVLPKAYSLNALFLAMCCFLLLQWRAKDRDIYLYIFAFVYGLSFLNHLLMIIAIVGFLAYIGFILWPHRQTLRIWRSILIAGFCFSAGIAPLLVLANHGGTDQTTGAVIICFIKGLFYVFIHPIEIIKGVGVGIALGVYQYPITSIIGLGGTYCLYRIDRTACVLIILIILGTITFLMANMDPRTSGGNSFVWGLHWYMPAYIVFALALAVGINAILKKWCVGILHRHLIIIGLTLLLPMLLYAFAPSFARLFWQNVPGSRNLPGRDNFTYVLSPWKHAETGAREYGEKILRTLPPNSVIFADYSIWWILRYFQVVDKARLDVKLSLLSAGNQLPLLLQHSETQNLYLADVNRYYDLKHIQEYFDIIPENPIYRIKLRKKSMGEN